MTKTHESSSDPSDIKQLKKLWCLKHRIPFYGTCHYCVQEDILDQLVKK